MESPERQRILDEEHLRLLRIGFYIMGAISAVFAFFPLIYLFIGGFMAVAGDGPMRGDDPGPRIIGFLFIIFGLGFFVLALACAALKLATAWALGQRRYYALCLVTSILACLSIPYGTALGVLGLIVLSRPSVKALFHRPVPSSPS